jgi:hypothetical protein
MFEVPGLQQVSRYNERRTLVATGYTEKEQSGGQRRSGSNRVRESENEWDRRKNHHV